MKLRRCAAIALALSAVLAGCAKGGADGGTPNRPMHTPFSVAAGGLPGATIAGSGSLTAYVSARTPLRASPGGRVVATLPVKTDFGSPQVLAVVQRQSGWLGVLSSKLSNGRVAWIPAGAARLFRVDYSLEESLSRRELVLRRGGQVVVRTRTAIGQSAAPTPKGMFAVTDRLRIDQAGSPYVCCVLALTAHQPRTPQDWGGGDRIAIHATAVPESIGQAVSLGCLRVSTAVMRRLVRIVPLGTPVRIRS